MNKENFEGYLVSTDLAVSESSINLLCENLEINTVTLNCNIQCSYRETHKCYVCNDINFELYSYCYDEWIKIFNHQIAVELREKFAVNNVSVGICFTCKKWKVKFSRKRMRYDYGKVTPFFSELIG